MPKLTFGVQLGNGTPWPKLRDAALAMDEGAWHSAWLFDHFLPPIAGQPEDGDCADAWSLLPALAAVTNRVRLGVLVTSMTFRNPALLAQMAATADQVSNGRIEMGIGAGWFEREHEAYGWEFPSLRERSDRLEEGCAVMRALFHANGGRANFEGKYYQLKDAPFAPGCAQEPAIPIMVGGGGEKRTLRTLAMYGDKMNVFGDPDQVRAKVEILHRHCEAVGRDPVEIAITVAASAAVTSSDLQTAELRARYGVGRDENDVKRNLAIGPADHVIEVLGRYIDAGVETVIITGIPPKPDVLREFDQEVISAFA